MKTKATVLKQSIGNDFSKKEFVVCFWQHLSDNHKRIKSSRTFNNTITGFQSFVKWVERHRDSNLEVSIILEPTGVYHENFMYYLEEHTDYKQSLIVGNQTKAFAQSLGIQTKTDKVDAKVLGRLGLERDDLRIWQPFSPNLRKIKQLCRERVSLIEDKTALSNRKHALQNSFDPNGEELGRLLERIETIDEQVKEIERLIQQGVKTDKTLQEPIEKICAIKGLRLITVVTIVAEMNGFVLFTNRSQVVSYCGYDVVQRQSGSSINGRTKISKRGNRYVRRALYFPAIVAGNHEPTFKALYDRVLDRSGIKMKAAVAVQRKLLVLIYALFTKNEAFDSAYQHQTQKELVSVATN